MARRLRAANQKRRVRGRGAKRSPALPLPDRLGYLKPRFHPLTMKIFNHAASGKAGLPELTPSDLEQMPVESFEEMLRNTSRKSLREMMAPRKVISSEDARRLYPSHDVNEFRALQVSAQNVAEGCRVWVEHHFVTGQIPSPPLPEISHLLECLTKVLWRHCEKAPQIARTLYGKPLERPREGDGADQQVASRSTKKSRDHGPVRLGGRRAKKLDNRKAKGRHTKRNSGK